MGRKKKRLERSAQRDALLAKNGVLTWLDAQIEECLQARRQSKVIGVRAARSRFGAFLAWMGKDDIALDALDARLMAMYETWLQSQKVNRNTTSTYLRTLQTAFNIAKQRGMTVGKNPDENLFGEVYTGVEVKSERPTVSKDIVQRLRDFDIDKATAEKGAGRTYNYHRDTIQKLKKARDIFVFSVYAQGMDFVDVCFLRKEDVREDTIRYIRRRTEKPVEVKLLPQMREIIERCKAEEDSPWLFSILTSADSQEAYAQYRNKQTVYARYLKLLSELMGLEEPLHQSSARDAWVTASKGSVASASDTGKSGKTRKRGRKGVAASDGDEVNIANQMVVDYIFGRAKYE